MLTVEDKCATTGGLSALLHEQQFSIHLSKCKWIYDMYEGWTKQWKNMLEMEHHKVHIPLPPTYSSIYTDACWKNVIFVSFIIAPYSFTYRNIGEWEQYSKVDYSLQAWGVQRWLHPQGWQSAKVAPGNQVVIQLKQHFSEYRNSYRERCTCAVNKSCLLLLNSQ